MCRLTWQRWEFIACAPVSIFPAHIWISFTLYRIFPLFPVFSEAKFFLPFHDLCQPFRICKSIFSHWRWHLWCVQQLLFYQAYVWIFSSVFTKLTAPSRLHNFLCWEEMFYQQFGCSESKHHLNRLHGYSWKSVGVNCVFDCQFIRIKCEFSPTKGANRRRNFTISSTANHPQRSE